MKPWPVHSRSGFTGFPNDVLARVLGELAPEQLRLFLGLVYDAEFKREGSISGCGRWRVRFGQVLCGYDSAAKTYGMKRDAVRRALRRFEGVAVAILGDPQPATAATTLTATSPTLVDFGNWFGIRTTDDLLAIPPATQGATLSAPSTTTIQHGNTGTPNTEASSPSPSAPAPRPSGKTKQVDPRHHPLRLRLEAAYLKAKGTAYAFHGGRDGRAVTALFQYARGDLAEIERRWRRALALDRYPGCASVSVFASRWNDLTEPSGRAAAVPDYTDPSRYETLSLLEDT